MTCARILRLLSRYSTGYLDPGALQRVALHLECCGGCRAEMNLLQRVLELVESLERIAPPEDLWLLIAARLSPMHEPKRRSPAPPG